ncbi:MAG: hypothetical protein R3Y51_08520, partial [Rikenellaceae bacterium]
MANFKNISNLIVSSILITITGLLPMTSLTSCQNSEISSGSTLEGEIIISSINVDSEVITKSSSITLDDLSVRIENTLAEVLRTWDYPSDVPTSVNVVPGSYQFIAWSSSDDLLPYFEGEYDEYFIGSEKFSIEAGEQHNI